MYVCTYVHLILIKICFFTLLLHCEFKIPSDPIGGRIEVKLREINRPTDRPTDRRTDRAIGKFHLNICGNAYVNTSTPLGYAIEMDIGKQRYCRAKCKLPCRSPGQTVVNVIGPETISSWISTI